MMRKLANYVALAALALLIGIWVLVLRPQSLGGATSYIVIRGSSMLPAYATGDLLIVRAAPAYGLGDVLAYRVPDGDIGAGRIVVHRVVGVDHNGFRLRGDHNSALDPWTPRAADIVGKVWVGVPNLGRILAFLHQPVLLAALAAALVVTLLLARSPARAKALRPEAHSESAVW
ncbi:MAG: signal peptidase I [Chloroflexi bacterium]|nr:MAG: signal peptidase I [Chloroflexota bacterium]